MPSLRDIRSRIKSVQNTQKITKAMQVVSASRLRRAQAAAQATRPYAEKMREVLATTAELAKEYKHPFLVHREGKRAVVIAITSDRGLAGAFNVNVIRAALKELHRSFPEQPRFVTIGRRGRDYLVRYGHKVIAEVSGLADRPPVASILSEVSVALDEYSKGEVDVVLLAYTRWISTLRQQAEVRTLVPVQIPQQDPEVAEMAQVRADYIYEPDPEVVLDALLPRYVETQVYQAVLESQASEHSARMMAMQKATDAAGDLIQSYTLTANKVRQATITAELMDIIGGAEVLRA